MSILTEAFIWPQGTFFSELVMQLSPLKPKYVPLNGGTLYLAFALESDLHIEGYEAFRLFSFTPV